MHQIGRPVRIELAGGEQRGGRCEAPEADVIVRPVAAGGVAIGIAGAVVQLRAEQNIDGHAIFGGSEAELAGGHLGQRRRLADHVDGLELRYNVAVARQHHPDVAPDPQCPGKGGGNSRQASYPNKVVNLGSDEQDLQEMTSCQRLSQ